VSGKQANDPYEFSAKRFGGHVRRFRLESGMTQTQLASRTGLHHTTISRLENGKHDPSLIAIFLLAGGLGVEPKELIQ
jgi:transcriptional regulator with XRE-family HTH domain